MPHLEKRHQGQQSTHGLCIFCHPTDAHAGLWSDALHDITTTSFVSSIDSASGCHRDWELSPREPLIKDGRWTHLQPKWLAAPPATRGAAKPPMLLLAAKAARGDVSHQLCITRAEQGCDVPSRWHGGFDAHSIRRSRHAAAATCKREPCSKPIVERCTKNPEDVPVQNPHHVPRSLVGNQAVRILAQQEQQHLASACSKPKMHDVDAFPCLARSVVRQRYSSTLSLRVC